jgi:hypothetical protein
LPGQDAPAQAIFRVLGGFSTVNRPAREKHQKGKPLSSIISGVAEPARMAEHEPQ